jgi:hypothetical protein
MVTTTPPRVPTQSPSWRFLELFWPDCDSPTGLDAAAARLLRQTLTVTVEQMLERYKEGTPLPSRCSLATISQERFQPAALPEQTPETLLSLLGAEARMIGALVQRPLGNESSWQWAEALGQQCLRVGQLFQALKRQIGSVRAYNALERVLAVLPRWA